MLKLYITRRSQNLHKVNPSLSPESVGFTLCENCRDLAADPFEVLVKSYGINTYDIYSVVRVYNKEQKGVKKISKGILFYMVKVFYILVKVLKKYLYMFIIYLYHIK